MKPGGSLRYALEPLSLWLDDDTLTEVCINRPGEVWTEGREGWKRHDAPQWTFEACSNLGDLIQGFTDKPLNFDVPVLSGSLPNGERVQVVIPPACEKGTVSITIRKPSKIDKPLTDLAGEGAFSDYVVCQRRCDDAAPATELEAELLQLCDSNMPGFLTKAVQRRQNIVIVGATGSGKTTITRSLIREIPSDERLVTIEDVHELFLKGHPNKVHLFYGTKEQGARMTAKDALASCLRMKPDRILLAELRGDEAWEYVKSVNTGHPGSITTMHANGAFEAFDRMAALVKDSPTGAHLSIDYIKHVLFTTIDVVLFYDRRKLKEVYYDPRFKHSLLG